MAEKPILGVFGGSGIYEIAGLKEAREKWFRTPFGYPSDKIVHGYLNDVETVFLSRHGRGHAVDPSHVPYRANTFAMKKLGVTHLLSITAVGSMKESIKPGDLVVVNQFFDHTKSRVPSFFGDGIVAHVSLAEPFCPRFSAMTYDASCLAENKTHQRGTLLCMEGPPFSTRAESLIYRQWGVDLIGMTVVPEAKLAREAEMCFAALALVTDFDCWHTSHEAVTAEMVGLVVQANAKRAKNTISHLAVLLAAEANLRDCACAAALKDAIMTNPDEIPRDVGDSWDRYCRQHGILAPLVGRYLPPISTKKQK